MKLFVILALASFSACSIQTVQQSPDVEQLLNNKRDSYLHNELYGHKVERFLRNSDFDKDELHEDQDNTDVYKGMTFAKLGQDTLNFHHDVKSLEDQLHDFRKHTESKLIPSELLSAANNVYIANAQFLHDKSAIHERRERLLEGQSRKNFVKQIKKKQRERELTQIIKEGAVKQQQLELKPELAAQSLDFDLNDIYNISKDDMQKFTKGLLKKQLFQRLI